jgi:hypothetical protein
VEPRDEDDLYERFALGGDDDGAPVSVLPKERRRGTRALAGLTGICLLGVGVGLLAARASSNTQSTVIIAAPLDTVVPPPTTVAITTTIAERITIAPTTVTTAARTRLPVPTTVRRVTATTSPTTSAPPKATVPTTSLAKPTHTVVGTLLVDAYTDASAGRVCGGTGRFSDFQVGQIVTVTDGTGATVAQGTLVSCSWSELQGQFNVPGQPNYTRAKALFQFSVTRVPEAETLAFRVSWKQWAPPFALSQMIVSNWTIDFAVR